MNTNSESTKIKTRNSNLELYRIIVMLLIVAHHYVVNSGLFEFDGPMYSNPYSVKSIFLFIYGAWGKIGINCFVMITGYFMCKSDITLKKFIKLLAVIMFYRIIISSVFWITGYESISIKGLIKTFVPVLNITTGFSSSYLVFFLFIPFINIILKSITEKQHILLILLFVFMYVLYGTLPLVEVNMNYVSWFAVLYVISAYVRLYPKKIFDSVKLWGCLSVISVFLSAVSVLLCIWLGEKLNRNMAYFFVTDSNTFLALLTGFCTFMLFKNLEIKNNRFINAVASTTFGILLIHANSDTMRQWLWHDLLDNVGMYNSDLLFVHAIGSVICIFVICSAVDYIRIAFIEKPFMRLFDKTMIKIKPKFDLIEDKICDKFKIQKD